MGEKTIIAWTNHTWNLAWGCVKIDPGCANCYADTLSARYGHDVWGPTKPRRTFGEKHWGEPLGWEALAKAGKTASVAGPGMPPLVFSSSMCDVFEDHPTITQERAKLWPLIRATPHLHWQLLTKRADRILANLPEDWGPNGYPNVWLGVSISEPKGCWRADALRRIPARVHFVSYEPALAAIHHDLDLAGIDWVIFGGESGPGYRKMDLDWARGIRSACDRAGVSFFFKQSAAPRTEMGTTLDGETVRAFPLQRLTPRP
jgi:protein gp37